MLITQPSFLGFAKNERSLLGIFFACFQVGCAAWRGQLCTNASTLQSNLPLLQGLHVPPCLCRCRHWQPCALQSHPGGWHSAVLLFPRGWP